MKVTYVDHSCFTVELGQAVFIFDYFRGTLPEFEKHKHIYFFASHKHHDHFSLDIFAYGKQYDKVTYVLSNDISLGENYLRRHDIDPKVKEQIIRIGKNRTMELEAEDGMLTIETLTSTDEGVAFILTYLGKTIYHAGDLNWWSWKGETEEEYQAMTDSYIREINKLEGRTFDLAFVVLDPRQEERYWWGFDYFMKATDTKVVYPMHCWGDYNVIDQMIQNEVAKDYKDKIQRDFT